MDEISNLNWQFKQRIFRVNVIKHQMRVFQFAQFVKLEQVLHKQD